MAASTAVGSEWPGSPRSVEPEPGWFPAAGLLLMAALVAVAVCAWWLRGRRHARPRMGWLAQAMRQPLAAAPAVLHARRLDSSTRLYVVQWRDVELLLAVSGQAAPTVLDRRAIATDGAR